MKNISLFRQASLGVVVIISLVVLALIGFLSLPTQAGADSITKSPIDHAFIPSTGADWTSTANLIAGDSSYAQSIITGNGTSDIVGVDNFNFNVPSDATITGIEVNITRKQNECNNPCNNGIRDLFVNVRRGGDTDVLPANRAKTGVFWPATDETVTYGGPNDLWGGTWTPEQVNSAIHETGVIIVAGKQGGSNSRTAMIDHITMTVYYTVPAPADTEAPVITVPDDIILEATSSAGAVVNFSVTALDTAGPVPATCDADSGDTFPLGETTVNCSASDSVPNTANAFFKITVQDTTAPVITLNGSNPQTVLLGGDYDEAATVSDIYDDNVELDIEGSVDTDTVGTYEITYNATDSNGNVAEEKTRTVNVVDQEAPVITLIGENPQIIEFGDSYTELGATVEDNNDDDLSVIIDASDVTNNINTLGSYTVTYKATDSSLNDAEEEREVNIVDTTIPLITLNGDATVNLIVDASYTDAEAGADDNYDGDISGQIELGGTFVDTSSIGTFTITYDVEDSSGNAALQVTRTIVVSAAPIEGCTDENANNHNLLATVDDGSCEFDPAPVGGCTDPDASNFDEDATVDDGSCIEVVDTPPAESNEEEENNERRIISSGGFTGGNTGGEVLGTENFVFEIDMKMGSQGNDVMELQKKLNMLGFGPLVVDGKFGPLTKAAVMKFQTANPPLAVDGIVGPMTRAVLNTL